MLRLNSSAADITAGFNREESLRPFTVDDDLWAELHGIRQLAESFHRWAKAKMRDKRLPAVGIRANRLKQLFKAPFSNMDAVLANSFRLGLSPAPPPLP